MIEQLIAAMETIEMSIDSYGGFVNLSSSRVATEIAEQLINKYTFDMFAYEAAFSIPLLLPQEISKDEITALASPIAKLINDYDAYLMQTGLGVDAVNRLVINFCKTIVCKAE